MYFVLISIMLQSFYLTNCASDNEVIYFATYLDVSTPDKVTAFQNRLVKTYRKDEIPKFLKVSAKLYLLIQVSWSHKGTINARKEIWTAERIQALLTDRKLDLRRYFPNPSKTFGGVVWLEMDKDANGEQSERPFAK